MTNLELKIEDIKIGEGKAVKKGSLIICHYIGKLDNGNIFESSYEKDKPFECIIAQKRIIQGWYLGLVGMREGGVRNLYIPSHLAYGERQIGDLIPPHSNLSFTIELIEVRNRDD